MDLFNIEGYSHELKKLSDRQFLLWLFMRHARKLNIPLAAWHRLQNITAKTKTSNI